MKSFGGKVLKLLLLLLYPVVVVLLVAAGIVLFLRTRDINNALEKYNEIYSEYDIQGTPKQNISNAMEDTKSIVGELFESLDESSREIEDLKDKVESKQKDGYGEIKGSILAFVSQGESFNRYQRVCAETKENESKQYCVSVSAIGKTYTLVVPQGEYYVFAQLQDDTTNTAKAYYTDFVKCNQDGNANCEENLSDTKVLVTVESGGVIEGIDPIDWQIEGIDISQIQEQEEPAEEVTE